MKYLKTHIEYNEGLRSSLAKAGLVGSLLTSPISGISKETTPTELTQPQQGKMQKTISNIEEISKTRKENPKDIELNGILDEIKLNINTGDSAKFIELYNKLTNYIQVKYNYKVPEHKVDELTEAGIGEMSKNMSPFEIMGWIGSICLAICGIPQAWQSYKDKHSSGISWGFVLLWAFGEVFAMAYVYDRLDMPLLLNYATNILILGVILYYKISPKNELES